MKHPKTLTVRQRFDWNHMVDAFRMIEQDLHHQLIGMKTIPSEWNYIHERIPERHPKKTRVTASFDADVVKYFKGLGRGYQERMNLVLRAYMHGRLARIIEGPDTTDYLLRPETIPETPEIANWGDTEKEFARIEKRPGPDPAEIAPDSEAVLRALDELEAQATDGPDWIKEHHAKAEARAQAKFEAWKKDCAEAEAKGLPKPPPRLR